MPAQDRALSRCVGDADRFVAESWGRRAHLHRGADVSAVLTVDDVDHIVTSTALRAPAFRLVQGGATLNPATYTRRARIGSRTVTDLIDVGRVYGHFAEGATIVLQGLHRYWPPVALLCRQLEDELTHPVQANAYITPPVAQGLRVHADAHDVFALQTFGTKQWVLYEDGDAGGEDAPSLDAQLEPGDCLYLPTGVRHAARTVDSTSIHLTLGVRTVTWADVLEQALQQVRSDPALDEPLPPGFARAPESIVGEGGRRLAEAADRLRGADAGAALRAAAQQVVRRRAPDLSGQLQQLLRVDDVDDRSVVRRRPHVSCELSSHDGMLQVALGDRVLRMPAFAEPAVRAVLARERLAVSDLGEHLDEPGRVTLVRRLVREGLLLLDG